MQGVPARGKLFTEITGDAYHSTCLDSTFIISSHFFFFFISLGIMCEALEGPGGYSLIPIEFLFQLKSKKTRCSPFNRGTNTGAASPRDVCFGAAGAAGGQGQRVYRFGQIISFIIGPE